MIRQLLIPLLLLPVTAFGALTVTDRGIGGSNASTSSMTVTPASNMAAGSMGVLCYGGDNANGSTPVNVPATITDSVGNVWRRGFIGSSIGANLSTESAIYTAQLTTAFTTSNNLVITFVQPTVAKAWSLIEIAPGAGSVATIVRTAEGAFTAATTRNLSFNVLRNAVIVGSCSIESADTFTGDADTTNGNWSTKQSIAEGTGAAGCSLMSQWKVVNATGNQSYDPTFASADGHCMMIAVIETNSSVRVAGGNATLESATGFQVSNPIAQGSMAVMCLATDNAGSLGSTASIPTTATDSKGNTWTLQKTIINDPAGPGAGTELGIYTCVLGTALDQLDILTVTYQGVNVTAKACVVYEFPTYTSLDAGIGNTNTGLGTAVSSGAVSITNAHLVVAAMGAEGADTFTALDTDTTNGSWSSGVWYATGTNATTDMTVATQFKIVNATGNQTWDTTVTSTDWATATISLSVPSASPAYLHFLDFFP